MWVRRLGVVVALTLLASCAPPLAPTPVPDATPIADATPHTITLDVAIGQADAGGQAHLTARVYSVVNQPIAGIDVVFTTDVGAFTPGHVATNRDGTAASTLTATATAHVLVTAGPTSTTTIVVAVPPIVPPTPSPPAPSPAPPAPPPPRGFYSVLVGATPNPATVTLPITLTATATPSYGTAPATSYDWDCDDDGTVDATTAGPVYACPVPALTTPAQLQFTASDLTPAIGQLVTVTATLVSTITPHVTAQGPAGALGIGALAVAVDWGAVQWQWDDTNDGAFEATIPAAGSPNARPTSYTSVGPKTMHVRVTDPVSGRVVDGTLVLWVGP